jgi:hypothetical protein
MENNKYWLHRISHEWDAAYKLLSEGWLTIGWSSLYDSGIDKVKDVKEFEKIMTEHNYNIYRSRWSLWNFLNFGYNDYVVVPLFNGKFSVYIIKGQALPITELPNFDSFKSESNDIISHDSNGLLYRPESSENVDLGFMIDVEPIKTQLSRNEYADGRLTARMKIRQTNADISDLAESINKIINADTPINLYASLIDTLAEKLLDIIKTQLNPDKFELLVKWYFNKIGATNTYRPAKNSSDKYDGADADIVAEFEPLKIIFYVQAKLHDGRTSQWAVEQISKYKNQHEFAAGDYFIIPWVISTADSFSNEAVVMAQNNNVRLIGGIEFAQMLIDSGITDINKAFE